MTVSVTGATGFIGKKLVQRLHAGLAHIKHYYVKFWMYCRLSLIYPFLFNPCLHGIVVDH